MQTDSTGGSGVSGGVTVVALCQAGVGAMLLFAPSEVSSMLAAAPSSNVIVQLLGAAVLGFAVMNWTARGSALGGIYGRAVVAGNQMHLMIGALLLLTSGNTAERPPTLWVLIALYVAGAVFFTYLTFFSSGLRRRR